MAVNAGMRNVPDTPQNRQLEVLIVAREMLTHTLKICSNEKIFDKRYDKVLLDDILITAKDIYLNCYEANIIYVNNVDSYVERMRLQVKAYRLTKRMTELISIARYMYRLRGNKVNFWSNKVKDTRDLIKKWHESDMSRYKRKLNI